jgi:hypothetical protein
LCSEVLVAYTIELDNEAEHLLPHRTTQDDDPDARMEVPWLVSYRCGPTCSGTSATKSSA